jgi:transcriptional regulator with XRE-family HTH domain
MSLRDVLARNLRRLRQARGLSQEALAAEAEITREYLGALERSGYSASVDVIERLAKALKVEPSRLLEVTRS